MKITITFTTKEKVAIMNAIESIKAESVTTKGNFGEMMYDDEKNIIDINFVEEFILGVANLTGTIVNITKSIINTFNIFESAWLKNISVEYPNREESKDKADESYNA